MAKKLEKASSTKTVKPAKVADVTSASKPVVVEHKPEAVGAVEPKQEKPTGAASRKFLGVLGGKKVIAITKKIVNGVEYNEVTDEASSKTLLSDRDLKVQMKPIE